MKTIKIIFLALFLSLSLTNCNSNKTDKHNNDTMDMGGKDKNMPMNHDSTQKK